MTVDFLWTIQTQVLDEPSYLERWNYNDLSYISHQCQLMGQIIKLSQLTDHST